MEYGIPGCTGVIFTRLRGEMVGAMRHPFGIQDSGSCWEWGRWARLRGERSGHGPPTCQIAATPTGNSGLVATPGAMLVGILMVIARTRTA